VPPAQDKEQYVESKRNLITVFSKPWPEKSLPELADFIAGLGLDGVELPVRPGFQVTAEKVATDLPRAAALFKQRGLAIRSVAGPEDEVTIRAMGEAGIPILRVMAKIDLKIGYMASIDEIRRRWDALIPTLEKNKVTIGVQNHCDYFVGSAIGLVHLIGKYERKHVAAVLDTAHCGLDGEPDDMAIDIAWPRLCLVNLKSAFWRMVTGPEVEDVVWKKYWTSGRFGITSWPKVIADLARRGYAGDYCLTAEYSNPDGSGDLKGDAVNRLIKEDIALARELTGRGAGA
jgi:sugar phosphate isomerase/epimerase